MPDADRTGRTCDPVPGTSLAPATRSGIGCKRRTRSRASEDHATHGGEVGRLSRCSASADHIVERVGEVARRTESVVSRNDGNAGGKGATGSQTALTPPN